MKNGIFLIALTAQLCLGQVTINHILSTGQSLSQGSLGTPALSKTQPYNNRMLDGDGLGANLVPLVEVNDTETMSSAMGNWLTANSPNLSYADAVTRHGQPGACYWQLRKGTVPYSFGMQQVVNVRNASLSSGMGSKVVAVTVVHGECDQTGLASAATYEANLVEWQSNYESDVKALTGQTTPVPMFTDQVSSWSALGITTPTVPFGQLAAAEDHPGKIYIVGPKYYFAYKDGVHLWSTHYRFMGEMYGKVMKKVLIDGQDWKPLSPRNITRSGNVITAQFWVPVAPLVFDTVKVLATQNYGFEYYDDSGAPPSISNVAITGPDTVTITLSGAPSGQNQRLRYAYSSVSGSYAGADQPGSPRGNLRDSDNTLSPNGYTLPDWCVHFDKPIQADAGATPSPLSIGVAAPQTASGVVTISANTNAAAGAAVQFQLDGANLGVEGTSAPYTFSWNTATAANGAHSIGAVVRDPSGATASAAPVTVNVANSPTTPPNPAYSMSFDFRATAGYVSDGANNVYVLCGDSYPVVRNGVTMGWESAPDGCQDQSAAGDPRLAGLAYTASRRNAVFRVDLPPGTYTLNIAAGDLAHSQTPFVQLLDGSAPLLQVGSNPLAAGLYRDINGNTDSASDWAVSPGTAVLLSSGILRVSLNSAQSLNTVSLVNTLVIQSSQSITTAPAALSTPFKGVAFAIPGKFEAEDFDNGGEGVAYHDTTNQNEGGLYRDTGVDIGSGGGAVAIGWTKPGEWVQYSINVAAAGNYTLQLRTAEWGGSTTVHLEVNGKNKTGTIVVPDSGGNWTTVMVPNVSLAAGPQRLRLVFDTANSTTYSANVDWIACM